MRAARRSVVCVWWPVLRAVIQLVQPVTLGNIVATITLAIWQIESGNFAECKHQSYNCGRITGNVTGW